jgi:hypothetical protein
MSSRAVRRRRGKRAARREGLEAVRKILELGQRGMSPATIASGLPVSEGAVEKILSMLEVSVEEGGGGT